MTITSLESETTLWLKETIGIEGIDAKRVAVITVCEGGESGSETKTPKRGTKSKNRSRKYVCPTCGQSVRATKEVNIVCGDCGVPFEQE